MDRADLIKKYESLTWEEKQFIHEQEERKNVKNDIAAWCEEHEISITPKQIDFIAYKYVNECSYDCDVSYWDNIKDLVEWYVCVDDGERIDEEVEDLDYDSVYGFMYKS